MKPTRIEGVEPNTPEWLKLRMFYRTASEAPIILGISPFTSIKDFKLIKAGLKKQYYSAAMRQGHELEDTVRKHVAALFGRSFDEAIFTRGQYLASLDGYNDDLNWVLEIKVSKRTFQDIQNDHIPPYYEAQIQQQLYCSGASAAYLAAMNPETREIAVSSAILPNAHFMRNLEAAWEEFDKLPLPDGPVVADENLDLLRALESYASIKREIERLEDDLDKARNQVLSFRATDRNVQCNGYTIEYRKPAVKTDYRKACKEYKIDLAPYQTTGEAIWAIKLAPSPFEADTEE